MSIVSMLETLVNKPIIKTWLEEGSIIFKNLITNPSKFFDQEVPFVYYFPPEVNQNNIIKKSDSLEIKYDHHQISLLCHRRISN